MHDRNELKAQKIQLKKKLFYLSFEPTHKRSMFFLLRVAYEMIFGDKEQKVINKLKTHFLANCKGRLSEELTDATD